MHALIIFISAFLLFSVQPLITKQILPIFGGSSSVWLISLVFFQLLLLMGYIYSHILATYVKRKILLHSLLLLASLITLPINTHYALSSVQNQYLMIVGLLTLMVGVPYFMLSTTAPLIQSLYVQKYPNSQVYKLYALSNLAALLALFSYPLYFEAAFSLRAQTQVWAWAYAAFVLISALLLSKSGNVVNIQPDKEIISSSVKFKWLAYSFLASSLLLAVTSHLTQNIVSIPLLWILPLAAYLLAFIIAFDYPRLFDKKFLELFLMLMIPWMCFSALWVITSKGIKQDMLSVESAIALYITGLFLAVYYLNGLIYKIKPKSQSLTIFYVYIALGGLLGSFFVAIICPLIFTALMDMQILLTLLMLVIIMQYPVYFSFFLALTIFINSVEYLGITKHTIDGRRGFYGALRVNELGEGIKTRYLLNGSILHGMQIMDNQDEPSTYYHKNSGIGQAIKILQVQKTHINVGMIGMGIGTVAIYARPGDSIKFFEIDPDVINLALKDFTYLAHSKGEIKYNVGDGRILVSHEPDASFDLLGVDAFSGDAIPIHLMTREAIELYIKKLKSDGILALHVSSGYVNLALPIARIAQELHLKATMIEVPKSGALQAPSKWVLLSRREIPGKVINVGKQSLWTDNYSNIWEIFID